MGVIISPVPRSRNGSDVHNLWGSESAQPGGAPASSQLDGCERKVKHSRGGLPRAAVLARILSPALWKTEHPGVEEGPRATTALGSSFLGQQRVKGCPVFSLVVTFTAWSQSSWRGGIPAAMGSSHLPSVLMPSWVFIFSTSPPRISAL